MKLEPVRPPTGNQPVFTANIKSKTAKKNDGIAIPTLVNTVSILSKGVFQLTAAAIPIPTRTIFQPTLSKELFTEFY